MKALSLVTVSSRKRVQSLKLVDRKHFQLKSRHRSKSVCFCLHEIVIVWKVLSGVMPQETDFLIFDGACQKPIFYVWMYHYRWVTMRRMLKLFLFSTLLCFVVSLKVVFRIMMPSFKSKKSKTFQDRLVKFLFDLKIE